MKHGRYANPIDPVIAKEGEAYRNRKKRARAIASRWYSRIAMLREAMRLRADVRGVDYLTDEEFDNALLKVHEYHTKNPAQKQSDGLLANCGPENVTERWLDKAH